ncbi:type VI secretion system tip protein VgrG [Pseudomonas shirazica]|nr:type VI secretion system tip protein VgrG [Pseudomonas shirazica]
MSNLNDVRFTFSTPADEAIQFDVVSFELTEGVSQLYRLEVELVSFADDADFATLLDHPALLTIWQQEQPVRHVHGLISSFEQGKTGHRRTRYRAIVEPQLARAGLQSDWRIFQHRPVPQLLEELFREHRWGTLTQYLVNPHQTREFCVQAGDLDLDFFWRLSAEEGLISIFEHSQGSHGVVQADQISQFGSLEGDPVLYVANRGGTARQPCLHDFRYREQVRTSIQVQRDYTFTHPRYNLEHTLYPRDMGNQGNEYERYDYPGRYKHDNAGKPFTQTRINALFGDARVAQVKGDDARLQPGIAFQLAGHAREDLNILWRPMQITHKGQQFTALEEDAAEAEVGTSYTLTATLIPARVEWHAPACPKPVIDGPQMAKVVGPPGEEIYCDEHGRVRVQFPWDRLGQDDDKSSCWVRVTQAWAGATWGHMAIPRIGQEVVVSFLDGDPDQPMITGRSYHIVNRPPYRLPEFKALSPIRSKEHHGIGPGDDTDDAHQRADVEQQDTHRDGVDGLGQGPLRVLGLRGCGADQLGTDEGEYGDLEPGEKAEDAMRHDHARGHQVAERGGHPGRRSVGRGDHHQAGYHQQHDGHDLDQAEPELHLAKRFHRQHVQPQQQEHGGECR